MPTLIRKYIQELYWQWVKLDITDSISGTTVSKLHSKFKSMYEEFSKMKCQPWSESRFKNCKLTGLYSIKNLKLFAKNWDINDIQSPKYKEKLCVTKLKYIV